MSFFSVITDNLSVEGGPNEMLGQGQKFWSILERERDSGETEDKRIRRLQGLGKDKTDNHVHRVQQEEFLQTPGHSVGNRRDIPGYITHTGRL